MQFFHELTSFGAKDTAAKVLYLCRDKKNMRTDLNIRDFYTVRDVLASVIEISINHAGFKQLPTKDQAEILNIMADSIVAIADSQVGSHPRTTFGISEVAQSGKGIDYETNINSIITADLFPDSPGDAGIERSRQVAISFSQSMFYDRPVLRGHLKGTLREVNETITEKLLSHKEQEKEQSIFPSLFNSNPNSR